MLGAIVALISGVGGSSPAASAATRPGAPGRCGGIAGFVCGADEWCEYDLRGSCGHADVMGTCRPRPEICPFYCVEVTGCDDRRYCNDCLAHQAGTDVLRERDEHGAEE